MFLKAAFMSADSECAKKKQSSQQCFFLALLGPMRVKAAHKMLMKLTPVEVEVLFPR